MWIFGYGSLVWKTDFPYESKVVGYIKGYIRRFWQASIDHRGVPENPGRVVTLVKSDNSEAKVWGTAYFVTSTVTANGGSLDKREKHYTERLLMPFYDKSHQVLTEQCLVYVGSNNKSLLLGPDTPSKMVQQIITSEGPSGSNYEYYSKLLDFLKLEAPLAVEEDEDIFKIEECMSKLKKSS